MIDDYKIIKKLGSGQFGTTYLVEKDNKKYALKIEKIYKRDMKKSYKSDVWREIDFATTLSNKYPEQFMTLYEYDFIDNCKHTQKYDESFLEKFFERTKSKYCSRKIYSLVDTTLEDYKIKSREQFYSIVTQLCYILYAMYKNGYTHNDFHIGNIGIIFTNKEKIKVFDTEIKTYGVIVQAIDYGAVLHHKYKFGKNPFGDEREIYNDNIEYEIKHCLRDFFISIQHFESKLDQLDINLELEDIIHKFKKSKTAKYLKYLYKVKDKYDLFSLFLLTDEKKFQNMLFGKKLKKYYNLKLYFSLEDMLFIINNTPISNSRDIYKIGKYFSNKI
jgi:hypothetical protein